MEADPSFASAISRSTSPRSQRAGLFDRAPGPADVRIAAGAQHQDRGAAPRAQGFAQYAAEPLLGPKADGGLDEVWALQDRGGRPDGALRLSPAGEAVLGP